MIIDDSNLELGNKAMASVLLLYYHLLREGGFTNDQTVYSESIGLNGFDLIEIKIDQGSNELFDFNEALIKEGAIIYLLCDLNDIIVEFINDFHEHPSIKKIILTLKENQKSPIPEVESLLECLLVNEKDFDIQIYKKLLSVIYSKYVKDFFTKRII